MKLTRRIDSSSAREALAGLIGNVSYEVMPFKKTYDDVLEHVPNHIQLTITVTEAKGLEPTLDLAERLSAKGYGVNPHLPARQIRDRQELSDIVARLREASIRRVFVVGGDAAQPAGEFADSVSLLRALDETGRPLEAGVTGYPEGHARVPEADLWDALRSKAPYSSRIVTQICFNAHTTLRWARDVAEAGISVPIIVGVPSPVSRQKLVRVTAGIGLGQSVRVLQKQPGLLRKFFTPGGFSPNRLLRDLALGQASSPTNIEGLRMFTFNEIAGTEKWRREMLASLR
ncbi:methylenetetrahydrofolate reductase [Sinomonas sp. ASV486]|uniref:methylenetetrahydrofolate reductase n=1 Tax=Sinomonas sp. ASV486 TaxID=3051170 RepID=UPI0027DC583C|nr:methylenetetrahydrofolate reductase [Sinomonas sp. ASV486]MDQ4490815.1 methylenetetrahydrofolate reductase [Sinomonas sp. ASV486]